MGFRQAVRARDYQRAAKYFDLRNFPAEAAENLGPRLARHLKIVLDQQLPIDGDSMSDTRPGTTRMACPRMWSTWGASRPQGCRSTCGSSGSHGRTASSSGSSRPRVSPPFPTCTRATGMGGWRAAEERVPRDGGSRYPALAVVGPRAPRRDGLRPWAAGHYPGAPAAAATSAGELTAVLSTFVARPVQLLILVLFLALSRRLLQFSVTVSRLLDVLEQIVLIVALAWMILRVVESGEALVRSQALRRGQTTLLPCCPCSEVGADPHRDFAASRCSTVSASM